ncbi:MAG: A/G-specific adenine glycosylase [Prevotella sp.]|nr:A/G-specific adenine glycosylase [Prevotella sp.]
MQYSEFTTIMLHWFAENGRELPWRETTDPYAIWLSEVILQQTRIQQGWEYWERFMRRWPTVELLAAATEDEVLREWQGLGYYSRARNLHFAAKQIVALGHFPNTLEEIKKLKGVGDYTAAAIGSIAFGIPVAVVDGNVYRVLARYFGIDTPINTTEGKKIFAELANSLCPSTPSYLGKGGGGASAFNQARMDFGASQGTPQSPRCLICPLQETCEALHTGRVEHLPVKLKTLKVQTRYFIYIYIRCKGETAIHRRIAGDIWQGLWEPYFVEVEEGKKFVNNRREKAESLWNLPASLLPFVSHLLPLKKGVKHVLTHRILYADFYLLEVNERLSLPEEYVWVKEKELDDYAKPRLIEILLEALS